MLSKTGHFFTKTLFPTFLSISSRYVTFQVNKNAQNDRRKGFDKRKLCDYFYRLYLLYLSFLIFRIGMAALVIHRIIPLSILPEDYFSTVDLLIGHMLKMGIVNRYMGFVCAPFIFLVLFDHWLYFGGGRGEQDKTTTTTYRLLYDLTVLNKRNFFQLNPQLGGWRGLVKLKLQEWLINTGKPAHQQTSKLKVTSSPLACLPNLPPTIRLRAALFSLTADLLTALLLAYFSLATALFVPYTFLKTSYLKSRTMQLLLLSEITFMAVATLYNTLLSLLIGHLLSVVVFVLKKLQALATSQPKLRIALLRKRKRNNTKSTNSGLATFLASAYLPQHNQVVLHFSRANEHLFSRTLFYFILATLVMNITIVTQLMFEQQESLKPEIKLHFLLGCAYQLAASVAVLRPMVATERVMVAAGRQHFRSQVYLANGSGGSGGNTVALSFKLAATTTTDNRKPYAFAFTLGPLGPVTAKFIMEVKC